MTGSVTVDEKAMLLRHKILGVLIRIARNRSGMTQKQVAEATGFSPDAISDFELGRRDITLPELEVLARVFGVRLSHFWAEEPLHEPDYDMRVEETIALRRRIIGVLLRKARTESGKTQKECADLLGCSDDLISNYEYGKSDIPLLHLEALASFLDRDIGYFFERAEAPSNGETVQKTGPKPQDRPKEEPKQFRREEPPQVDMEIPLEDLTELPEEVKEFLKQPANLLYVRVAMYLSRLSARDLRRIAEGLLEISF